MRALCVSAVVAILAICPPVFAQCDIGSSGTDMDGDRVCDDIDTNDSDAFSCADEDLDGCDDCSIMGVWDPNSDGTDTDSDGLCDVGDSDDDNDGVLDPGDPSDTNPDVCGDGDFDTCDDCAIGTDDFGPLPDDDPYNDGPDCDGDGDCDAGDPDDDDDGTPDVDELPACVCDPDPECTDLLFSDGFESGNTDAWSSKTP